MAFFDELGKRISKTGQTAVQKTKDVTEIARLSSAISDEEKKINVFYNSLGKKYYQLHSEDSEEALSGFIKGLKECEEKIDTYKKQIQDIKGVIRCKGCGAEIPVNALFCSSCGKKTEMPPKNSDFVTCSACGMSVSNKVNYCTNCGSKLNEQNAVVQNNKIENSSRTCPKCYSEMPDGVLFCTICGTSLTESFSEPEFPKAQLTEQPVAEEIKEDYVPIAKSESGEISKICPKCYSEMPDSVLFCTNCGTSLTENFSEPEFPTAQLTEQPVAEESKEEHILAPKSESEKMSKICPKCKREMPNDVLYCTNCGKKLTENDSKQESVTVNLNKEPIINESKDEDITKTIQEQIKKSNICPKCKSELREGMLFCTKCGEKLTKNNSHVDNYAISSNKTPNNGEMDDLSIAEELPVIAVKICPNCMSQMPNDMIFCTKCGKKLN